MASRKPPPLTYALGQGNELFKEALRRDPQKLITALKAQRADLLRTIANQQVTVRHCEDALAAIEDLAAHPEKAGSLVMGLDALTAAVDVIRDRKLLGELPGTTASATGPDTAGKASRANG